MEFGVTRTLSYTPPRRVSSEYRGASVSAQDGECAASALVSSPGEALSKRPEAPPVGRGGPGALSPVRASSLAVHKRHMPMQPDKFQIPKKEKKDLLKHISTESREYEGVMSIVAAGHADVASAACFTYSCPRLVHSEQLEKEFVEKRRAMKADGRTDKELEESYCFLLTDETKVPRLCEKGLIVGPNWQTALGDPNKGVYLSRYSDLIQGHPFDHGASGQIIVFKVMKGKVKSIYENVKNTQDPTPGFDSHLSKNVSKVTSVASYRAFEYTQHYFYEYDFAELKPRPRQVCPYAVVTFHYKGKDVPLPAVPSAPVRANSWPGEPSKEVAQYTVWSGDLVHHDKKIFPISLRSSLLPSLPHKLPDKLEPGRVIEWDALAKLLPPLRFFYKLYRSSREIVTAGNYHWSVLEVVDGARSAGGVSRLLPQLEDKNVVLVSKLTERGFLFLLSSAQLAAPSERGESWKRCLHAVFVFPESREVKAPAPSCASSCNGFGGDAIQTAGLKHFIPALHHALTKSQANPTSELATGVELQAQEYLVGQKEGKVRAHDVGQYDVKAEEIAAAGPAVKRHRLSTDVFLHAYFRNPACYQLAVAHATKMVELHCAHLETPEVTPVKGQGGASSNAHKLQQLMDLVLTCKRNAENEVRREEARAGGTKTQTSRRRVAQRVAGRALKYLKASHQPSEWLKSPAERAQADALPGSLTFAIQSVGLVGASVQDDGSELAVRLNKLLTGLKQATRAAPQPHRSHRRANAPEDGPAELSPFGQVAAEMGLPANRDMDLRTQDELEEQTAGSVSSLEGFSPSGESYHYDPREGGGRRAPEDDIPWRLIPITGLCSERYARRERNLPQDPRLPLTTEPPPGPVSSPGVSPPPSPATRPPPEPYSPPRRQSSSPPKEQRIRAQQLAPPAPKESAGDASSEPPLGPFAGSGMTTESGEGPDSASAAPSAPQQGACMKEEPTDVVDLTVSSEEEESGGPLASSQPPSGFPGGIDDILDKHLGHFSADLHLLLQEESVKCQLPEALPYHPAELPSYTPPVVTPFSQYVSLYHPCPPVQGYISSLQDGISSVLRGFRDGPESALASTVGAFVSSIRAGTDEDETELAPAAGENEAGGQFSEPPPASLRPRSTQSDSVSTSSEPPGLPPAAALSDVIRHLRPEVLSNLCDIIKDVQRSSVVQFYLHAVQPDDQLFRDVKEYLLQQGYMEQDPVSFLKQEVSERKLLVIVKKKDIEEHIHEIPGLVLLKQHPSVVFLGIDALEDVRTNTYQRLFACGGCVLSEDMVLKPDLVTPEQLEALLALVEKRNSPESVWRWKIHSKHFKKLNEQARFRRDAARLLEVIVKYQKQKIVEVLPQHLCDGSKESRPDLRCLIQHQGRSTRFKHTIFLRVHSLDFMRFSKSGIITAGVNEMLQSFDALLGLHRDENQRTVAPDPHAAQDSIRNGGDGAEHPASPGLPRASEPRLPKTSPKKSRGRHSVKDLRMLHEAISHLRAQMQPEAESSDSGGRASSAPRPDDVPAAAEDGKEGAELSSSREADDSVSSGLPCIGEAQPTGRPECDPGPPAEADADERPRKSPSRAPPAPGQPPGRRGASHYRNQRPYQMQQQHPQERAFYSDPHRNPARGFQQAGQGFSGGYWHWQQGGGRGFTM